MARPAAFVVALLLGAFASTAIPQENRSAALIGLWEAWRDFTAKVHGSLLLIEREGRVVADVAGYAVPVIVRGDSYAFELPDNQGSFRGHKAERGQEIHGFWFQPPSTTSGAMYSSPVTLRKDGGAWRGEVTPLPDRFTYFLPVTRAPDGTLATYLRNPERNDGIFTQVQSIALEGDKVTLTGNRRGSKEQKSLFEARFVDGRITGFPGRGGSYEFDKVDDQAMSALYPRGKTPATYRYEKPLQRDDGWPTASVEEVGIDRAGIEALVKRIVRAPMDSVGAGQVHSVLIARHGKLVVEEYFHGHDRDSPHELRSASKSLTSILVGAAMQAGIKVSPDTPVYATMLGTLPADIDPRKRAMKLEHLLTMTGGHFCDDNNDDAPGNENTMQDQDKERDWYRFILALPMDRTPGERIVYCSIDAHLAGGVLQKAAGEPLQELFDRLVARPMRFGTYYLFLAPTRDAYMGGGAKLLPRDFLKISQLMVNGGTWEGRRIVSREWAQKATSPMRELNPGTGYGYLWYSVEYPYRDRKVRAIFAAGNGGQVSIGVPELDLAIAFTGGSYADRALFIPQRVLVPELILPAVK